MTVTYKHEYQLVTWSFPNIGNRNYANVPVTFFDGTSDEDDRAEQNYAYSGSDILQILARSDITNSTHSLQVQVLNTNYPDSIVLALNARGMVVQPAAPNDLSWMSLAAASTSPILIGTLTSNQTYLGLGVIDLALLFSDPTERQGYLNAIAAGPSYAQSVVLSQALKKLITGATAQSA